MLRLQRYSLDVNYTRGSDMHIADTLSRAYIPGEPSVHAINIAKADMTTGLSVSPRRLKELQAATADYCVLQRLIQMTVNGWPSHKSNTDLALRAHYSVRHVLTVKVVLVFKDCRTVVPIRYAQGHYLVHSQVAPGDTGLHTYSEGHRLLAADESANRRLRQSMQHL